MHERAREPEPLILPIVYHDFQSWKDPNGHPDFEHYLGNGVAGSVNLMLSTTNGGVPVHVPMCVPLSSNLCAPPAGATPPWDPAVDWFGMWYIDTPTYNKTIVQTLTLGGQLNGANSATCNTAGQPACSSFQYSTTQFFPIDGMGWGNTPAQNHNFGFTSVMRYWFQYAGAATLSFFGDDDVFVYINKTLAIDLGGIHQRADGSITIDAANGTGYSCDLPHRARETSPGSPWPAVRRRKRVGATSSTSVCKRAASTKSPSSRPSATRPSRTISSRSATSAAPRALVWARAAMVSSQRPSNAISAPR